MFVELASLLTLVDLVVVGDHLVRRRRTTCADLVAWCAQSSDRGAQAARRAAAYVRDRVDSPMETRVRMLIVLAGIPEPEVNLTVRAGDGMPLRRVRPVLAVDPGHSSSTTGATTSSGRSSGKPTSTGARPTMTTAGGRSS